MIPLLRMLNYKKKRKSYSFHRSFTGARHLEANKVCQDYAISFSEEEYSAAIVCDGHGGDRYFRSHLGSLLAGNVCLKTLHEVLKGRKQLEILKLNPDKTLQQLIANIIFRWREEVSNHFLVNPLTDTEKSFYSNEEKSSNDEQDFIKAYGTTLIAAVRLKDFWFGFQIGDGKCVIVSENGEYAEPIPWDDKCFLNTTTSLCDSNAAAHFRYYLNKENLPVALFIGTDGIDDSFLGAQGLYSFYAALLKTIMTNGLEMGLKDLDEYLPKVSEKGSGDDVSVAGIIIM